MSDVEFKDTVDVAWEDTSDVEWEGSTTSTTSTTSSSSTTSSTVSTTTSSSSTTTTTSSSSTSSSSTTTSSSASTTSTFSTTSSTPPGQTTTSSSTTTTSSSTSTTTSSSSSSTTSSTVSTTSSSSTTTSSSSSTSSTASTTSSTVSTSSTSTCSTTTSTSPFPSLATLTDDFGDWDIDDTKWEVTQQTGCTAKEAYGHLELTASGGNYSKIKSVETYELLGSYGYIKVQNFPNSQSQNYLRFLIESQGSMDRICYFQIIDDTDGQWISANLYDLYLGTVQSILQYTEEYDEDAHQWLRIRRESDTVYFDTSPNGHTWQNFASVEVTTPTEFRDVRVEISYNG